MKLRAEALLVFAGFWFIICGITARKIDGISLLGFYPLLLRVMREEMR